MYKTCFKRITGFTLSLMGFIVLFPIFLSITLILAVVNNGKPFFFQERPGKDEKIFKIIKFKTMNDKKDIEGNLLPDKNRLTSIGSFIRKTSLDEIPQLINVIKGDMSLIGPRPLLINYLPYYTERERIRHTVRPGITGYAQVNGRNTINWNERLELDVLYSEDVNLLLDTKIFLKTIKNIVLRKDVIVVPGEVFTTLDKYRKNETKS